jgi:cytochrome c peroxidase
MTSTSALVTGVALALALAGLLSACTAASDDDAAPRADDLSTEAAERRKPSPPLSKKAALGALLFADTSLSEPPGQSCATCHDPRHAFADPRRGSTSEGAVKGRFGVRNTPSIVYASFAPELLPSGDESGYAGGLFWDGRVSTLEEQAVGPLLNPIEMNNPDKAAIQKKLARASYAAQLKAI